MQPHKRTFQDYEMRTDQRSTGEMKKKLQRKVRGELKQNTRKEIEDPEFDKRPTTKDRY